MAQHKNTSIASPRSRHSNGSLGLSSRDAISMMGAVRAGLPLSRLTRFVAHSGLSMAEAAKVLRIPPRTLARRKTQGVLTELESERLVRLAKLFDQAKQLFEGDGAAATRWLGSPVKGLGNKTPLQLAQSELGARAVEDLIGRLEFGVYS